MSWTGRIIRQNKLDFPTLSVLDVGSKNVNGTTRGYFRGEWHGLDMEEGPDVTTVGSSHAIPWEADSFDVVISTEMLEHDPRPDRTLAEISRVLHAGGHAIITARGPGFGYHGHPFDYFRYTTTTMFDGLLAAGLYAVELIDDPEFPGVFAHATCGAHPSRMDLERWVSGLDKITAPHGA